MSITELRCTSCMAPIDPSRGLVQRCAYCGATLTLGQAITRPGSVRLDACGPNKISVIAVIRSHTGLGLKEAKDLAEGAPCMLMESDVAWRIERFRENLVSAGARVTVVAPLGALVEPEPVHGKGVFLDDHGPNKIAVIKVVLDHTACGLREAKELVESAPCVVGKELDDEGAARLKNDLLAAGARVR